MESDLFFPMTPRWGFPGGSDGKESACGAETWIRSWVRKIPWRREWPPSLVSLPGESHGQRSLAGYSPWGHKESDTTEQITLHFLMQRQGVVDKNIF